MAAQAAIHASLPGTAQYRMMSTPNLETSMKEPCVYIAASKPNGVLYIGVTSDLHGRMAEHDQALIEGFTKCYRVKLLVYYEFHDSMPVAIQRESQLKKWRRAWKVRLIEGMNPQWVNLFDAATGEIAEGPADGARQFPR